VTSTDAFNVGHQLLRISRYNGFPRHHREEQSPREEGQRCSCVQELGRLQAMDYGPGNRARRALQEQHHLVQR
jgi:hypothetical protein